MVKVSNGLKRKLLSMFIDFILSAGAIAVASKITEKKGWKFKRKIVRRINKGEEKC